jgi:hypothetical protein
MFKLISQMQVLEIGKKAELFFLRHDGLSTRIMGVL